MKIKLLSFYEELEYKMNNFLTPEEIAQFTVNSGIKKANMKWYKQILLAVMSGIFIALAANGSSAASYGITPVGLSKALAGTLFATGLIFVVIAGGELFTGNCLIMMSVLDKKTKLRQMIANLICVYFGNFIGSVLICFMAYHSSQYDMDGGLLGASTIKTAVAKCSFGFKEAFFMGVLCNIIVCLAVWVASAAKDIAGKVLVILFPIYLFVSAGFEHSVANMYYITAGLFAKCNDKYVEVAKTAYGITPEKFEQLNIKNFLIGNLVPVTLGNIVGGAILIAGMYWLIYIPKKNA